MIQINLIPDVKLEHITAVRQKKVVITVAFIAGGASLAVVLLLVLAVFGVQKTTISDLSGDIEKKIGQLQSVEDLDKVLTIQNQLGALPDLYDTKPNSNNLFKYLSVITPTEISLTDASVSLASSSGGVPGATGATSSIGISGGTTTFKDVNRFVDILKNAKFSLTDTGSGENVSGAAFSNVVLESISQDTNTGGGSGTSFTVSMQYDPRIFDIKYDEVVMTVPKIESSVSSTEKPNFNPKPFNEEGGQ